MRGAAMPKLRVSSRARIVAVSHSESMVSAALTSLQRQVRGGERDAQLAGDEQHHGDARRRSARARYSVWPVKAMPASLITLLCTGAVTMASNSPPRAPSTARSSSAST